MNWITTTSLSLASGDAADHRLSHGSSPLAPLSRKTLGSVDACDVCGEQFTQANGNQKRCSRACHLAHYAAAGRVHRLGRGLKPHVSQDPIRCRRCGRSFLRNSNRQAVCNACSPAYAAEQRRAAQPDAACSTCKTAFRRTARDMRYCSEACRTDPRRRADGKRECLRCGIEFWNVPDSHKSAGPRKYCALKCARGAVAGSSHPLWIDGDAKARAESRARAAGTWIYQQWRSAVLRTTDRKCARCGSSDRVEAHHIAGWWDAPALRYDVRNGEPLCKKCHAREEGRRTRERNLKLLARAKCASSA